MSNFITVVQSKGEKKKIHYVEVENGETDTITNCGLSGPFENVKITYQDRFEGRVCKKCFKSSL